MAESPYSELPPIIALQSSTLVEESRHNIWGGWATLGWSAIIAFAYLAVQVFVAVVYVVVYSVTEGRPPVASDIETNGMVVSLALIACVPVVVGSCIGFVRLRKGLSVREYLGLHWPTPRQALTWTLALIALIIASDYLTLALNRPIVPDVMVEIYHNTSVLPVIWVAIIFAAPVSEELLFRGFMFRGLAASRVGGVGAVLITATLWAVIHIQYDIYGIVTIFASGILLGIVRIKTGSVLFCMVLHAVMNLWATLEVAFLCPKV